MSSSTVVGVKLTDLIRLSGILQCSTGRHKLASSEEPDERPAAAQMKPRQMTARALVCIGVLRSFAPTLGSQKAS